MLPAAYPQQKGIVEGRLINRTDPSIVARGVELEAIELGAGMSIIKTATTDSSGRFRFEGLPQDQRLMIRANYKGSNYYSMLTMDATGKASADIEVYEPTTSMKDIRVERAQMAFQLAGDQLKSLETLTFNNQTKPPKTFAGPEGAFRISKSAGIMEIPQIRVTAPGSSMPVVQPALESADGQSYYSQYPLRPGTTTFEVQQTLPYANRNYTFKQKFYQDIGPIDIAVFPQDLALSGQGVSKIQTDSQRNISVYISSPIKTGSEIAWTLSGGTPVPEAETSGTTGESTIESMPNDVERNALILGPLLLMGFIIVLWFAYNRFHNGSQKVGGSQIRQLKELREQLLNSAADLDHRYETHTIKRPEFLKLREETKRQLRRISLLLKKM